MGDRSATRVIRDVLERILSREQASAVLFEALDAEGGEVPRSSNQLMQLVRGSLASVLARQVGDERAATVVASVENELKDPIDEETTDTEGTTLVEQDAGTTLASEPVPPLSLDDDLDAVVTVIEADFEVTRPIPVFARPVSVVVVAAGQSFADRLLKALGAKIVAPIPVSQLDVLQQLRKQQTPSIVVVDAGDFPRIEPGELTAALGGFPETTAKVLWCARLPYGRRCADVFDKSDLSAVMLDPGDGIEPVLDLIRSRREQESAE